MSRRSMKEKLQTGANFKKYAHFTKYLLLTKNKVVLIFPEYIFTK